MAKYLDQSSEDRENHIEIDDLQKKEKKKEYDWC